MILLINEFSSGPELFAALNKARLENKGKWIGFNGEVNGSQITIKTYGHNYLQVFKVNNYDCGSCIDAKVGKWKKILSDKLNTI